MRVTWTICALFMMLSLESRADVELKNDSFQDGTLVAFHGGFVSGEVGASRFVAPSAGLQLLRVQFLFGYDIPPQPVPTISITLKVYDDSAGTVAPGGELFSGDFTVTPSNMAMQEINLATDNVMLPMKFRVGIMVQHSGPPSIADDRGGQMASANFIYAIPPNGWVASIANGDWIIRAFVSGGSGGGDAGVVTGSPCNGNPDCPGGQYCDLAAHACTYDCLTSDDCGGETCNSLGKCVGGGGGGCCDAGRGNYAGGILLALGVLTLVCRRRTSLIARRAPR